MNRVQVELGPVQETLLIPLLGRAEQTRRKTGLIRDPKSIEIVDSLDYDFSKWKRIPSLVGASIRTRMFDEEVLAFLKDHESGSVVEIGAGLNTRFERLDNQSTQWLEVDLPDSMQLRRRFFDDSDRRTMLSADALATDWFDVVSEMPGPYCFVAEAVLIYLENEQIEPALERLARRFPGSWLITDTTSAAMVDAQRSHDAMKTMPQDSWFRWKCDDPATLSRLGLELVSSKTFFEASPQIMAAMPIQYRMIKRFAPWLVRKKVESYHINRFVLNPSIGHAGTPQ